MTASWSGTGRGEVRAVEDAATMDELLALFGAIVEHEPGISDGEVVWTLAQLGVDQARARRIVAFAPVALGRVRFGGRGIAFDATYIRAADGASRPLAEVAEYAAAVEAAPRLPEPYLGLLAQRSAEARAVLEALRSGSEPADLLLAPVLLG